jgi:hypothetical protein
MHLEEDILIRGINGVFDDATSTKIISLIAGINNREEAA